MDMGDVDPRQIPPTSQEHDFDTANQTIIILSPDSVDKTKSNVVS